MDVNRSIAHMVFAGTALSAALLAGFLLHFDFASGAWFDEYATLWYSDPAIDLRTIYHERWTSETNPPAYYLLIWLARHVSDSGPAPLRAINLVFLGTAMAYAAWAAVRHPRFRPFIAAACIIFLSSGDQFRYFAELRSYYWQIAWSFAFCLSLTLLLARPQPPAAADRLDRPDCAVFAVALFALVNLHFTSALLAGAVSAAAIVHSAARGDWRLARFLTLSAAASASVAAVFVLAHLGMLSGRLHAFWISTTTPQALRLMGDVARGAISRNVVLLALLVLALPGPGLRRRPAAPNTDAARVFATPFAIALVFVAGALAFFAVLGLLNLYRPIVILRYLVVAGAPLTIAACICVANLLDRRPVLLAALFANGVLAAVPLALQPGQPRDDAAGFVLAQLHAACPGTPILGLTYGEPDVTGTLGTGYRDLARRFGVPIETYRIDQPWAPPRSATCPTVLWHAHLFDLAAPEPSAQIVTAPHLARILRLRLTGDDLAHAGIRRLAGAEPMLVLPPRPASAPAQDEPAGNPPTPR